jgi:hypothetical protein
VDQPLETRSLASWSVRSTGESEEGSILPGRIPPNTPRSNPGGTSVRLAIRARVRSLVAIQ